MSSHCERLQVIASIERIFEHTADSLLDERQQLSIEILSRGSVSTNGNTSRARGTRKFQFPGKTEEEAWRFGEKSSFMKIKIPLNDRPYHVALAVIIRVLQLIHEATTKNIVLSKRDIFYRDPALFRQQKIVDKYVDDVALTLGVTRSRLNVTAAAKGLYLGSLTACRLDGSSLTSDREQDGTLVPHLRDILSVEMSAVSWILIVEKEATFRSIASSRHWRNLSTNGVMITGKGYPDISTRQWLYFLGHPSPRNGFKAPPTFCLTDFDPDGVSILSTYCQGSKNLAHEQDGTTVPGLRWLGLRKKDMGYRSERTSHNDLLVLSSRDRARARGLLSSSFTSERLSEKDWRCDVQAMLMLNLKAELQVLGEDIERCLEQLTA